MPKIQKSSLLTYWVKAEITMARLTVEDKLLVFTRDIGEILAQVGQLKYHDTVKPCDMA